MVSSHPSGLSDGVSGNADESLRNINDEGGASSNQRAITSSSSATKRPGAELRVNDDVQNAISSSSFRDDIGSEHRTNESLANSQNILSIIEQQSQSGPSSLSIGINPVNNPDEENYEGFGYADKVSGFDQDLEIGSRAAAAAAAAESGAGYFSVASAGSNGGDSGNSSAPSPTGPNSLSNLKSTSPSSTIGRHSWLRTSLRRTSPSTNARQQRPLGSNALASQLYRSGSFNSSGRGSNCDAADEMYSDVSLEDDVIDLNHRVRMIQEQMHVLTDTHSVGEERYARVKQENATLQARILMLEEAAKDAEARAEEKLEMEQRRHREWACRLEREKQLQLENYSIKMQTIELECSSLRDQVIRLREQLDTSREDRARLDGLVEDLGRQISEARDAERQALIRCNEARVLLDEARQELSLRADDRLKFDELENELSQLRARNKSLEESRDEFKAAAALHAAGRELLMLNLPSRSVIASANAATSSVAAGLDSTDNRDNTRDDDGGAYCSLAVELSADAVNDRNPPTFLSPSSTSREQPLIHQLTVPELQQRLKEQQEVNAQLRSYIDDILLNIVENYPQLLEVKRAGNTTAAANVIRAANVPRIESSLPHS